VQSVLRSNLAEGIPARQCTRQTGPTQCRHRGSNKLNMHTFPFLPPPRLQNLQTTFQCAYTPITLITALLSLRYPVHIPPSCLVCPVPTLVRLGLIIYTIWVSCCIFHCVSSCFFICLYFNLSLYLYIFCISQYISCTVVLCLAVIGFYGCCQGHE
jgi:hypothetical protein